MKGEGQFGPRKNYLQKFQPRINADSNDGTFLSDDVDLVYIDLKNFSLDGDNFNDSDPETVIHVRRMGWCSRHKRRKACKKEVSKELMPVV